ncbi:hypothetical protein DL93DRAFT_2091649 [Clavulina sp. PMI_390]|nr:hypothetical protein DL93DRAFT_2091649 [Clavulina sp. PMI_390]
MMPQYQDRGVKPISSRKSTEDAEQKESSTRQRRKQHHGTYPLSTASNGESMDYYDSRPRSMSIPLPPSFSLSAPSVPSPSLPYPVTTSTPTTRPQPSFRVTVLRTLQLIMILLVIGFFFPGHWSDRAHGLLPTPAPIAEAGT